MAAALTFNVEDQSVRDNQECSFGRVADAPCSLSRGGIKRCFVAEYADAHCALEQGIAVDTSAITHEVERAAIGEIVLAHRHAVFGEGTGLIGADNRGTPERFHRA